MSVSASSLPVTKGQRDPCARSWWSRVVPLHQVLGARGILMAAERVSNQAIADRRPRVRALAPY
jgi:hypothetical protein